MNVFCYVRAAIEAEIAALIARGALPAGLDLAAVAVEPPRDPSHGDIATNAALVLAKPTRQAPRQLAERLAEGLLKRMEIDTAEVAGPGFLNLRLKSSFWQECLKDILEVGDGYGDSALGHGRRVNVEYVSANPTGPMHVGHCRGAVFGDALANLLERAGYSVTREYYINDAGAQIDVLARSAYLRYREALGATVQIPEGLYPGEYLIPVGQALAKYYSTSLSDKDEEWLPVVRDFAVARMMDLIKQDLDALAIHHEVFFSERALHASGRIAEVVSELEQRGLVYVGVLEPPKGKLPDDWEPRPQLLFRATNFGDDVDRPLKKSDGSWTYFAADIAYHYDKFSRGADQLIDVLGADHGGYVKRMQAAVAAVTEGKATLDVKICQLVRLFRAGEPVRMSKRAGSFVTLRDVVDEVGKDAVRFMMLYRKNDAPLDFDFAKVTEQSKDNPVFYVQYAHARVHSVLRNARELMPEAELDPATLAGAEVARLCHPSELGLIKQMTAWPRLVGGAADAHEPHRVAFYLYDLASLFHGLWNMGKEDESLRFLIAEDRALTRARLALVRAVGLVIAAGLHILGVEPVEEMR